MSVKKVSTLGFGIVSIYFRVGNGGFIIFFSN